MHTFMVFSTGSNAHSFLVQEGMHTFYLILRSPSLYHTHRALYCASTHTRTRTCTLTRQRGRQEEVDWEARWAGTRTHKDAQECTKTASTPTHKDAHVHTMTCARHTHTRTCRNAKRLHGRVSSAEVLQEQRSAASSAQGPAPCRHPLHCQHLLLPCRRHHAVLACAPRVHCPACCRVLPPGVCVRVAWVCIVRGALSVVWCAGCGRGMSSVSYVILLA